MDQMLTAMIVDKAKAGASSHPLEPHPLLPYKGHIPMDPDLCRKLLILTFYPFCVLKDTPWLSQMHEKDQATMKTRYCGHLYSRFL
jgi:hypothetical protein